MTTQATGLDEQALRQTLTALAKTAKSNLAWIAANHTFFKSHQQYAPGAASELLALPERYLGVPVAQFPSPQQAREAWDKAVADFGELRGSVSGPPTDDPGHYLNKSAVVYAVATVEGFLSDAYREAGKARCHATAPKSAPASLRPLVAIFGRLQNHKGKGNPAGKHPENTLHWARDALFLAEVRHTIVHNQGRVDEQFLKKVGAEDYDTAKRADEIWAKDIWPHLADFQKDFKPPDRSRPAPEDCSQVCLNITKVIIPYMVKCADFIDASVDEIIAATKAWPTIA